jgi:hypothetical protein
VLENLFGKCILLHNLRNFEKLRHLAMDACLKTKILEEQIFFGDLSILGNKKCILRVNLTDSSTASMWSDI